LVVTKAGPGTLAEAFAVGLPVIVSSYIPGQESANPWYVAENGAGIYLEDPVEIAQTIREWIADSGRLRQMSANAGKLARPQASLQIAERLIQLVQPEKAMSLPERE
jgi:1,2-diacylglycerol 3-beta-galactosyltransferase